MLPKINRITEPEDFKAVMKKSKRRTVPGAVIYTRQARDTDAPSRFGVIAPNKNFGSAVKRNRAKRVIRAWFAEALDKNPHGIEIVVRIINDKFEKM